MYGRLLTDAELLFSLNFSGIVKMCFKTVKNFVDISFEDDKSSYLAVNFWSFYFLEARFHTRVLYEFLILRILSVTLHMSSSQWNSLKLLA